MPGTENEHLTVLLNKAQSGDAQAAEEVWESIYRDVRGVAASLASREQEHYEPTVLVAEVWKRTRGNEKWDNRRHFFASVRRAIQQFLIDEARRRKARPDMRRSGRVELTFVAGELSSYDVAASETGIEVFKALEELENADAEQADVVRLRYIEGRTIAETAELLGVSPGTVKNRWRAACAWLRRRLAKSVGEATDGG